MNYDDMDKFIETCGIFYKENPFFSPPFMTMMQHLYGFFGLANSGVSDSCQKILLLGYIVHLKRPEISVFISKLQVPYLWRICLFCISRLKVNTP